MGKSSVPPPPDYTPIAAASQYQAQLADQEFQKSSAQADKQFGLQSDALAWAKGEQAKNDTQNQSIIDQQLKTQDAASANAADAQSRYKSVYQPLEDQAVHTAMTYDSPQQEQLQAGAAQAAVAQQFDAQRVSAAQNLESFGIDPSSTRYAALDTGVRTAQAAASAAAGNTAIQQTQATARGLQANAINVGRGLPSDVNAGENTSINAGNSAANVGLATTASGANTMGTAVQYGGLGLGASNGATGALGAGNSAIGTWGNTVNAGYNNQLGAYNARQNASSGIGSILGTAASFIPGLADGGAVPDSGDSLPQQAVPTPNSAPSQGGAVPVSASPSGGRQTDDVHAKLNAGEFVVPRDALQWKGEEFFQKLIQKTRQDRRDNAPAQPRAVAVPTGHPAFSSRPHAVAVR
jgi:hypothetical protein